MIHPQQFMEAVQRQTQPTYPGASSPKFACPQKCVPESALQAGLNGFEIRAPTTWA